jgi:hypothetical protein
LEWFGLAKVNAGRKKIKAKAYIEQVPCPDRSLLVSAYYGCFPMPKASPTAIFCVRVTSKIIEQFSVRHVHETDVRVQCSNQQSLAILGGDYGGYRI